MEEKVGDFFVGTMVFGIVHLVCSAVPLHVVRCSMAVPQQHATLEHFAQAGAAVHPALYTYCASHCARLYDWQRQLWNALRLGLVENWDSAHTHTKLRLSGGLESVFTKFDPRPPNYAKFW